ncbi:MAG: DNA repair protein RecN [Candidatus Tumulicola sp.]
MLRRLEIENYGLIARAAIEFARGATIFTGETGSGKTMLLGALGFVLGARAGGDAVRRGEARATVTLAFDAGDRLRLQLAADGFELDPGEEATIIRDMSEAGRSSVRVCGRPSTAAYVREFAGSIAEIVGQFEAQRLLVPSYHEELLDRFAGNDALRARESVARAHARGADLAQALSLVQRDEHRARERYEDAMFAVREIEEAQPQADEEERLSERQRYLENAQRIADALGRARESLTADDYGAIGALGTASAALSGIANIGEKLRSIADQAAALQSQANDLAAEVVGVLDAAELGSQELDAINARLDLLGRLKRKYGSTLENLLAYAVEARANVAAYEGRDRQASELAAGVADSERELHTSAKALTALRKRSASLLTERVSAELADLALGSGRFEVAFEKLDRVGARGAERTEFQFAANAGEPMRPLMRVASGGELSRLLLALVVALSGARDSETALVFDEIDTGIGGATGTAVGVRIGRLARDGQVVCVTHLAQLATWANRHYLLEKDERRNATTISVREISGDAARAGELARMLSGETHDVALKHARSLLKKSQAALP